MFQAIEFPTSVAYLYSGLADMNRNHFALNEEEGYARERKISLYAYRERRVFPNNR
jgi:hypothetical protein